jgi:ribosomal protein L2
MVGRAAAAPAMNNGENILNLAEGKKTKVNSECRCHVINNVNSSQSTEKAGKNFWLSNIL